MSSLKYPSLLRISLIREYGLNRYRSKDEFITYLEANDFSIAKRTLNRDFEFLRTLHYTVDFSTTEQKFKITDDNQQKDSILDRYYELQSLEEFKTDFSVLYKNYVIDEESKSQGLDNLKILFKAIDNHLTINFDYKKFNGASVFRNIAPMQLKVANNRWYVLGYDYANDDLRVFGLDRITAIRLENKFIPKEFPVHFIKKLLLQKYYLGVTRCVMPEEQKCIILLKVSDFLIEYWKSKPIHFTQNILDRREGSFCFVEFELVPNIDLIKLIVSSLGEIEILGPLSFKEVYQDFYNKIII